MSELFPSAASIVFSVIVLAVGLVGLIGLIVLLLLRRLVDGLHARLSARLTGRAQSWLDGRRFAADWRVRPEEADAKSGEILDFLTEAIRVSGPMGWLARWVLRRKRRQVIADMRRFCTEREAKALDRDLLSMWLIDRGLGLIFALLRSVLVKMALVWSVVVLLLLGLLALLNCWLG